MTNDILSWYPTDSSIITSDLNQVGSGIGSINILNFILSLIFVLLVIYGIYFLLQMLNKNKSKSQEHLLKKIIISPTLTIDFIQINKRLYILANNQNSIELLDVIKQEKEILEILGENSENLDKQTINERFENALKTILKKTDEIEKIKK